MRNKTIIHSLRMFASILVAILFLCSFSACSQVDKKEQKEQKYDAIKSAIEKFDQLENGTGTMNLKSGTDISFEELMNKSILGQQPSDIRFSNKNGKLNYITKTGNFVMKILDGQMSSSPDGVNWKSTDSNGSEKKSISEYMGINLPDLNYISDIKSIKENGITKYTVNFTQAFLNKVNSIEIENSTNLTSNKYEYIFTIDDAGVLIGSQNFMESENNSTNNISIISQAKKITSIVLITEFTDYNSPDFEEIT